MGCGGLGGCGGGNSFSGHNTSNHSAKKMPNWGMSSKPRSATSNLSTRTSAGGFGTPKVKMSFGRKR